jgi:hypothetical protein
MNTWKDIVNDAEKRRLQVIGQTRWWKKEVALRRIFGHYGEPESGLYVDLILALQTIESSSRFNGDVCAKARSFKESLLKYETLLTAHVYLRVFKITTPLSKYLQTSGLDLLKCHQMVEMTTEELEKIQRDFDVVEQTTLRFIHCVFTNSYR